MARITSYSLDQTISDRDKVVGTDSTTGSVRNYTLSELANFIKIGVQDEITLTTTGTSGVATFDGTTLNIPQYAGQITLTTTGTSGTATFDGTTLNIPEYGSSMTIGDGTTTVNNVDQLTFSGATLVDNGSGDVTLTIDAGSSITVSNNSGLAIDGSDVMSTIYNSTIGDAVESIEVGGIAAGTPASELKSKNIVQVLDDILFPTILASIQTAKSVVLTTSGATGTLEIGSTVSRTLTATFNDGAILNGDGTSGPDLVGAATQYTFTGTGISSTAQAGNTLAVSNTIVSGSNSWAVTVNHDAGTGAYYDNKGNAGTNLDASRVSGTTTDPASSPTITGVYPVFWFKSGSAITASSMASAIQAGSTTKVVTSSTGTITIDFNATGEYLAVAYPATSTTKTKWYVNALDNGAIPGGVFGAASTQSVTSPDAYWSGVSYKIHVSPGLITQSEPIELRNS